MIIINTNLLPSIAKAEKLYRYNLWVVSKMFLTGNKEATFMSKRLFLAKNYIKLLYKIERNDSCSPCYTVATQDNANNLLLAINRTLKFKKWEV